MEEKNIKLQLDKKQIDEISEFIVRKREQIMWILWAEDELTQGELAKKADSTATSLSNILLKFEKFKYKLLNCESRGVRKYYSLSDVGMCYMQSLNNKNANSSSERIIPINGSCLLKEARRNIKYFQERWAGEWEIVMEDALLNINYGIDNGSSSDDVEAFTKYIYCIEKLLIAENEVYFEKAMQLIQSEILRKRIDQFLEGFYLFLPVIQVLEDKNNIFDVYMLLEKVAKGYVYEASATVNENKWNISCEKISEFLKKINLVERRRKDIYRILSCYLPDKMELAAMLTQIICTQE